MLKCTDISFAYSHTTAPVLKNVTIELQPGKVTALLGRNAGGKSTLLKIFSGLLRPDSGTVTLDGKILEKTADCIRAVKIAAVPQLNGSGTDFTVYEMVLLGRNATLPRLARSRPEDRLAAERALKMTDTAHLAGRRFCELSGGERQRVLIASALAREAGTILLDEPTSALDPSHAIDLMNLLKKLPQKPAVLAALHDIQLAAAFADRIVLLHGGGIFAQGAPEEVLTEENIRTVYGCQAEITVTPGGLRHILLYRTETK